MSSFYLLTFTMLFGFVIAGEHDLLSPCRTDDIKCLSESTEQFLEKTHKGLPEHNIQAIDPLVLDRVKVNTQAGSAVVTLSNIQVTGLRKQKISDFRMDTKAQSVSLATSADIEVRSDLTVEIPEKSKIFKGKWIAKSNILGKALYDYKMKKDDKGVEHFEVGPEVIEATVGNDAVAKTDYDEESTKSDKDFAALQQNIQGQAKEIRDELLKKIIIKSYEKVVSNLRTVAKLLPKSAFFTDV